MAKSLLKIDDIDRSIIQIVQNEPNLTHTQIAKRVKRSQPTVGMRIRKLEKAGVLKFQAGINLKTVDLSTANVQISTNNPEALETLIEKCPYMLNGFRQSGNFNFNVILVAYSIEQLDHIVNNHFRNNPDINLVELNIITNVVKDFVLPFKLDFDRCENGCNNECCGKCFI